MGFFEIVILGFIINYFGSKFKKMNRNTGSLDSIKDKMFQSLDQIETPIDSENYPSLDSFFETDEESDKAFKSEIDEIQADKNNVDSQTIDRLKRKYRNDIRYFSKDLKNQVNQLIEKGPKAVKDKAIQLSAYHPNREKLLEIANYFEDLVIENQEEKIQLDLNKPSSTVTDDFHDFSDMDYEMEQFIIEGEELAEFSQPMQVQRLTSREDSTNHSNQLKEAIIWSEILGPPRSKK
ncbi:hypothetical protein [Facklamia sp. 7083-14-GEN3]|uniref:hypothetical protein n=1 Tax=Facklamia sp. 7083-14-GEN3 TaxID=2973478 RepID=UPI00215C266F|nr:hypothetical protein [Facklamia sp. 7083-14-GEN3]MCR8968781.1 hypothetical protein [Facklamia sp. 7083-14-GEN3]